MRAGVNVTPRPLYPRQRDPVRIVQEDRWILWPVWTGGKNFPLQVSDPQTVQPVASRYTDYTILSHPTSVRVVLINFCETPINEVHIRRKY
jgi:hypothetical protein